MSRYIEADSLKEYCPCGYCESYYECKEKLERLPSIDIVRCKECKHRPIKEDEAGEAYGFNVIPPAYGDERCPCLVEDGWYSWIPNDDFFCGYGERIDT